MAIVGRLCHIGIGALVHIPYSLEKKKSKMLHALNLLVSNLFQDKKTLIRGVTCNLLLVLSFFFSYVSITIYNYIGLIRIHG